MNLCGYFGFMLLVSTNYAFKSDDVRQESARVIYMNPKYMKELTIFTSRRTRNSPYLSTLNITILKPWGNNVTTSVEYVNINLPTGAIKIESKFCDFHKIHWLQDWFIKYSDIDVNQCPVPAGTYHVINMELPPKNFPIAIIPGEYSGKLTYMLTGSKEKIAEIGMNMKFHKKFEGSK